jgi:hypothetical protein
VQVDSVPGDRHRAPCFGRLSFDEETATGFIQFADGSRYIYPDAQLEDFQRIASRLRPGSEFNYTVRRAFTGYYRTNQWPAEVTWSWTYPA